MFKDILAGQTHSCSHPTENPSGICDKCLGRAEDVIGVEISGTQSVRIDKPMQKETPEWEDENIFRGMLDSFYGVLEHNKKASIDMLINAIKRERDKAKKEGRQEGEDNGVWKQSELFKDWKIKARQELIDEIVNKLQDDVNWMEMHKIESKYDSGRVMGLLLAIKKIKEL